MDFSEYDPRSRRPVESNSLARCEGNGHALSDPDSSGGFVGAGH